MDFTNPATNLLSQNTYHTSSTYVSSTLKLLQAYELTQNLYGPKSKNILINQESLTLTSLPDTLYSKLPINHVVTKLLKENIVKMQDLGDGSTFMCNLSCTLAKHVLTLVQRGMNRKKISKILKSIRRKISEIDIEKYDEDLKDEKSIQRVIYGVLKNKKLTDMFITAIKQIDINDIEDGIRILKIGTGTLDESYCVKGMIFKGIANTEITNNKNMRTSIFNCPIEISKTTTKGVLILETASELLNFSKDEEKGIKELVDDITKNADLIICNGKIEDLFLDYIQAKNKACFSIYSKHDIRRIRNLFGGSVSPVLREIKENGNCSNMSVFEDGNAKYTKFEGEGNVVTIVIKNSISVMLDEYERSIKKGIAVIKKNYDETIKVTRGSGKFEEKMAEELKKEGDKYDDSTALVYKAIANALNDVRVKENNEVYDIYNVKIKAMQYAIDVCNILLETEDYFYVKENLNIQPRQNRNWDDE
ncbi:T-complex protein 1 subunit theta [Binucleata daphniae]